MMPMPTGAPRGAAKNLLECFDALDETGRDNLLAYAEFLVQRQANKTGDLVDENAREMPLTPLDIPRPENESVVAAIRRLSETYPMVDRSLLLNETSTLMSAHIMHGREAVDVIDELQELFLRAWREGFARDQLDDF